MEVLINKIQNEENLTDEEWKFVYNNLGKENLSSEYDECYWEKVNTFYKNLKIVLPDLIKNFYKLNDKKIAIDEFILFEIKELEELLHDFVININWKNSLFPLGRDEEENIVMMDVSNKSKLKIPDYCVEH